MSLRRITRALRRYGVAGQKLMAASPWYRRTATLSALLLLLTTLLPLWRLLPLARARPFIPLHYNVYFGIDRFGPWQQVFLLPGLGLAILVINIILETVLFEREGVLAYFFAAATVLAETVLLTAMIAIVLLNL